MKKKKDVAVCRGLPEEVKHCPRCGKEVKQLDEKDFILCSECGVFHVWAVHSIDGARFILGSGEERKKTVEKYTCSVCGSYNWI